ncbi:TPA: hypothetical protein N0F65_005101 [Lagenidium giganteum]|uniref:START domain-containing protein n=1 Tax=Lagenidium giganteum TaxID=4803 RepID=A0AAV2Z5F6_9STRA|nr:TPA: hypothetical protein N0F65_005101 [Lagenidium giganteum]
MVLSADIDRPVDEEVMMPNADASSQQSKMIDLVVPVPAPTVRAHLSEFEDDSVRRLLLRQSGKDVLPNGWKEGPHSNGIQVYHGEVADNSWNTMMTTGKLAVSAEKAMRVLVNPDYVPKYDEMTATVRVLEVLSEATQIRLVSCKSVMFTGARDFCVATTVRKEASGRIVIATRSVEHPEGVQSGYVRALSYISGYILTPDPTNPDACEIAVLAHMDLGGYMPAMVINYVGLSAPIKLVEKIHEVTLAA